MTTTPALQITVVGGGIMGRNIALALALAGHSIAIVEPKADVAATILDQIRASAPEATLSSVRVVGTLDKAVPGADIVIEAVPENMELKKSIWTRLNALTGPHTILATNTSALDIDVIASEVDHPERVLGTHWFNPAHVVPCVELVRGAATSDETVTRLHELLSAAGKQPVVVKNSPGFVANRIQFALVREALLCLEEGLATAEDIDAIVSSSFGIRLAALGPLANADLGGLDTYHSILTYLSSELGPRFDPPQVLTSLVEDGRLGVKSGSGVHDYTPESAAALTEYRDRALERVLAVVRDSSA